MKNRFSRRLAFVLAASLSASVCMAADDPDSPNGGQDNGTKKSVRQAVSSSVKPSEKAVPRIWIGLTGSYTPLKQIKANNSGNIMDANGDTFTATSAQGLAGGGAIVNVRILHGFGLSIGAIYRFTGYDAVDAVNDVNGTVDTERTRVRLLDLPLMVRYSGKKWNSKHTFYELGGVVRQGFSIQTTTNSYDGVNGELGAGPTSGTAFKHRIFGAVAGAGLIGRDDFGIVVSPEVRYTRWMEDTFSSPNITGLVNSNKNQLEITVSFGF